MPNRPHSINDEKEKGELASPDELTSNDEKGMKVIYWITSNPTEPLCIQAKGFKRANHLESNESRKDI